MKKEILDIVEQNKDNIREIDQRTMHSGAFQALDQLRQALNKIEKSLNNKDYEKASNLGYNEVAHEFVFLQRTLGGLQDCLHNRQKLIQDIAMQAQASYEEVSPYVEQHMDSVKTYKNQKSLLLPSAKDL